MHKAGRPKVREKIGIVVSDKMQKTAVVRISTRVRHHMYKKVVRHAAKFKVHDEKNEAKIGDRVLIAETKPISKDKRWRLVKVVEKASL